MGFDRGANKYPTSECLQNHIYTEHKLLYGQQTVTLYTLTVQLTLHQLTAHVKG